MVSLCGRSLLAQVWVDRTNPGERTLDFGLKRPISLGFYSDKFISRNDMLMFWCQSIEHKKLHKKPPSTAGTHD